jgi:aryl-alcohol dehydrogenase-like predicted oxidoreductase
MKLALGTVQFGLNYGVANSAGQVSLVEAGAIIDLARAANVDVIDTAAAYGESEVSLGRIGVGDFSIVTKLPPTPLGTQKPALWVRNQFEASLARLGCNSVYGYLMHRPEELDGENGDAIAGALREIREDGLAAKVGISIYDPEQIARAARRLDIDLVQAPLNLLDRRILESGEARKLREAGIELHTRSAFLQGLLLFGRDSLPAAFDRWRPLLLRWHDWLESQDVSAARACLDFAASFQEVDRVVVGVDTQRQFAMLLEAAGHADEGSQVAWPDIRTDDPDLINPARWKLS